MKQWKMGSGYDLIKCSAPDLSAAGLNKKSSPIPVDNRALIPCRMSALSRLPSTSGWYFRTSLTKA